MKPRDIVVAAMSEAGYAPEIVHPNDNGWRSAYWTPPPPFEVFEKAFLVAGIKCPWKSSEWIPYGAWAGARALVIDLDFIDPPGDSVIPMC